MPAPIMVAYDGSESAQAAIREAARLFPRHELVVTCVWTGTPRVNSARLALPDDVIQGAVRQLDADAQEAAKELAKEAVELAGHVGMPARAETVRADPSVWAALVRVAKDLGADVMVVGSRGRSSARSALLGSVSSGVVHHAACPVLVVRHSPRRD